MSEQPGQSSSPPGAGAEGPKKKLSPLEQIRAKAAAKDEAGKMPESPPAAGEAKPEAPAEDTAAGKPMSKLEAIRAAAAAKKAAAGEAAPAAKREAPAAKEPRAPKPVEAKEKPARPAAKPVKPKEAAAKEGDTRRGFLLAALFTWVGVAWASFTAGCVAALGATVRFMYPNVLQEPPNLFKIGPPDKFEEGVVYEQWKNEFGVWIVRHEGKLYAIRTVCTHLGCTPNWLEGEQKFKCPCHGSGFRKTGINFEGPAPRPLERYTISLADDGQVQIDKGRKWQYELGQWTKENGAFIEVA
jgi:cytochrome b6-f complex iron-sulfur subunit